MAWQCGPTWPSSDWRRALAVTNLNILRPADFERVSIWLTVATIRSWAARMLWQYFLPPAMKLGKFLIAGRSVPERAEVELGH